VRQKKIKKIRKQLQMKLPVKAEYKVIKTVHKTAYFKDTFGAVTAVPVQRQVLINASKYQYRQVKKVLGGK
jgi:hypothetical protein